MAFDGLHRSNPDTLLTDQQIIDEALNFAAYGGHEETVDFLLEKGADPNGLAGQWWPWDANSTPLHKAVMAQDAAMIRYLCDRGADPTIRDRRWEETPHQWSRYFDDTEIPALLLEIEQAHLRSLPSPPE